MTTVLIAVGDSDDAVATARLAHRLFGDSANYYAINVDRVDLPWLAWGTPYPVVGPVVMSPDMWKEAGLASSETCAEAAEERAAEVADDAELPDPTAIADIGDPSTAILRAAHEHDADVIVVGSHERGWFSRLLFGSVGKDVVAESDIPVLVVK
jgi:nucleotide-binding universal stress UspA family protein